MEEIIGEEIRAVEDKTSKIFNDYQQFSKGDIHTYLDKVKELNEVLNRLARQVEHIDNQLIEAINTGKITVDSSNVEKINNDFGDLISVGHKLIDRIQEVHYGSLIKSSIEDFKDKVALLEETVEDLRDIEDLSCDKEFLSLSIWSLFIGFLLHNSFLKYFQYLHEKT